MLTRLTLALVFVAPVAALDAQRERVATAVGPAASDTSRDGDATGSVYDARGVHAVKATRDGGFHASGSDGRVGVYHAPTPG